MENNRIIIQRFIEEQDLVNFLNEIDNDFIPKISDTYNILEYTRKLLKHAELFIAKSDTKIIGIIAFYCNDVNKENSHIPVLGIYKSHRGLGLGSKLLTLVIDYVNTLGFKTVSIETWKGSPAQFLYKKHGFKIIATKLNEISGANYVMMRLHYK
jgi:ribosomal protein S18 acetylase RimI-like enzyme